MRRRAAASLLLLSACAGPRPCTRALCPAPVEASYRVDGWNRSVTVAPGTPRAPVVSDSSVEVLSGEAVFTLGKATLRAAEGATFRFVVSTGAVGSVTVGTGTATVAIATAAPVALEPGVPFALPRAK